MSKLTKLLDIACCHTKSHAPAWY